MVIIVQPPLFNKDFRFFNVAKQLTIEKLILKMAVKRFAIGIGLYGQIHPIQEIRDDSFGLPIPFIPCTGESSCW